MDRKSGESSVVPERSPSRTGAERGLSGTDSAGTVDVEDLCNYVLSSDASPGECGYIIGQLHELEQELLAERRRVASLRQELARVAADAGRGRRVSILQRFTLLFRRERCEECNRHRLRAAQLDAEAQRRTLEAAEASERAHRAERERDRAHAEEDRQAIRADGSVERAAKAEQGLREIGAELEAFGEALELLRDENAQAWLQALLWKGLFLRALAIALTQRKQAERNAGRFNHVFDAWRIENRRWRRLLRIERREKAKVRQACKDALNALEDVDTAWTPAGVEIRQQLRAALGRRLLAQCRRCGIESPRGICLRCGRKEATEALQ